MRPRLLALAVSQARGVGLVELLLIAGAAVALSVAGVAFAVQTGHKQEQAREQQHVADIVARTLDAYAASGDFSTLTAGDALASSVYPKDMLDSAGQPHSIWGSVEVTGVSLPDASGNMSDRGFAVTYDTVPTHACAPLVANVGPGFYDVTVGGTSVLDTKKHINMTQVTQLCDRVTGVTVQFVYAKDGDLGVTGNLPLGNCVIPPLETQRINCPSGQIDANPPYSPQGITQQREASCPDPYGAPNWTAWHTTANTCAPICSPPAAQTRTSTPCPAGQTGIVTEQRTASCPAPTGPFTWGGWTQTGNTCAPTCATRLGTPPFAQQHSTRATTCGAGEISTSNQAGTNTAACASPGAAVDPVFGGWVWTGGSCATLCVVPASQQQQVGCPAGYTGVITQQRDGACPSPLAIPTYGGWYQVANSCALPPPPPPPPAPSGPSCPGGQSAGWELVCGGKPYTDATPHAPGWTASCGGRYTDMSQAAAAQIAAHGNASGIAVVDTQRGTSYYPKTAWTGTFQSPEPSCSLSSLGAQAFVYGVSVASQSGGTWSFSMTCGCR